MITDSTLTVDTVCFIDSFFPFIFLQKTFDGNDFFIVIVVADMEVCQDRSRNTAPPSSSVDSINVTLTVQKSQSGIEKFL